jgi:thiamine transport system permease protein
MYELFFLQKSSESFLTRINPYTLHLLYFTLYQAFLSTVLSIFFGILLAWSLNHWRYFRFRSLVIALFSSALVLPSIVIILGIITLLGRNGWINQLMQNLFDYNFGGFLYGLSGILIAHVYFNASYVARSLLIGFESIPNERYKLSKSLGLNIIQRFYYIEWVEIKPYIFSLASIVFLLCFSSFVIILTLGGSPTYNTLEVAIYEAVKFDFNIPYAVDLSFLQIAISSILLITLSKSNQSVKSSIQSHINMPWLESKKEMFFHKTVVLILFICFSLPLIAILVDGLQANFIKLFHEEMFVKSFITSIILATLSTVFTVVISIFLSLSKVDLTFDIRAKTTFLSTVLEKIITLSSSLYLTIPSIVMGVGFFILAKNLSFSIDNLALVALLFSNILLSLPFSMYIIYPAMSKVAIKYDKLSFSLGVTTISRWKFLLWPFLKSSLSYVSALSFCLSLGDLSIIALFGNQDISTLPWYLYEKMGSYRTQDAAGIALILLFLTLIVFIFFPRVTNAKH